MRVNLWILTIVVVVVVVDVIPESVGLNVPIVKDQSQTVNIPNTVLMLERLRTKLLELAGDTMLNNKYNLLVYLTIEFE
jgi:hypothetical protein